MLGGQDEFGTEISDFESYDNSTGYWTCLPTLPAHIDRVSAAAIGN